MVETSIVSLGSMIRFHAISTPTQTAIISDNFSITWQELHQSSNKVAHKFIELGVSRGDFICVSADNSIEFFTTVFAIYKVGAVPQPLSPKLTNREYIQIIDLVQPFLILGFNLEGTHSQDSQVVPYLVDLIDACSLLSIEDLPDITSPSWKAPTSGGSTGLPKVIVSTDPGAIDIQASAGMGMVRGECMLIPGPMYHNGPFSYSIRGLAYGLSLVTTKRFSAKKTLELVEKHQISWMMLVPTMMNRIWKLEDRFDFDLSSIKYLWHLASKCPDWLKHEWINWIGSNCVYELYAGTESQAITAISGDEWLKKRGSVGRAVTGEIAIFDPIGNLVKFGVEGEIYMRANPGRTSYRYLVSMAKTLPGGWESLGDLGSLDEDGYLYIGDRLADMIVSGGANIYPAEVECALEEHQDVLSSAVVGVPDPDLGKAVHAVVQIVEGSKLTTKDLLDFLSDKLIPYKHPRTIRLTYEVIRDNAGKVRRSSHVVL